MGDLNIGVAQVFNVTNLEAWAIGDRIADSSGFIPPATFVTGLFPGVNALTISAAPTGTVLGARSRGEG